MLEILIFAGAALGLISLPIFILGLCRSASRADRQADEYIELLRSKYNEQVRRDLTKKG